MRRRHSSEVAVACAGLSQFAGTVRETLSRAAHRTRAIAQPRAMGLPFPRGHEGSAQKRAEEALIEVLEVSEEPQPSYDRRNRSPTRAAPQISGDLWRDCRVSSTPARWRNCSRATYRVATVCAVRRERPTAPSNRGFVTQRRRDETGRGGGGGPLTPSSASPRRENDQQGRAAQCRSGRSRAVRRRGQKRAAWRPP